MLGDHAARSGFEGGGKSAQRVSHVMVDETLELWRFVAHEECRHEQKQLRLATAEVAHALHDQSHVALLLPHGHGGRMFARARQPGAVARTLDFDQPLRAAADRTDLFPESRTAATRAARAA